MPDRHDPRHDTATLPPEESVNDELEGSDLPASSHAVRPGLSGRPGVAVEARRGEPDSPGTEDGSAVLEARGLSLCRRQAKALRWRSTSNTRSTTAARSFEPA